MILRAANPLRHYLDFDIPTLRFQVEGARSGPARLHLVPHVNAPVADLPVRHVSGGLDFIADLTLPYGRVLHDYKFAGSQS